jgi:hypothetical protein
MKKLVTILAAGALLGALLPVGPAAGNMQKKPTQEIEGAIALPAPFTDDSGCYAGLHRRGTIATLGNNSGIVGYHFDVDPKTWNKNFALEPTGGDGDIDLDIYFYSDFGKPGDPDDPLVNNVQSAQFNTRDTKGEFGKVPPEMNQVIVCMMLGGTRATFTYKAGKGVKLPKKS